jgi:LPS-assembly protein
VLLLACPALAQEAPLLDGAGSWNLEADSISAMHDAEVLEARGNVVLTRGENFLRADFARYYQGTGWVYLEGDVTARWEEDLLSAAKAEFDLTNMVGWLEEGRIFVAQPHLYFEGATIQKHAGETYSFKDARVTACDDSPPAWAIDVAEGEITLDGYAKLWHARFLAGEVPLLYTPFLVLPAKTTRQSGLLTPDFGSSSRLGTFWHQPYYQVLGPEADMTFSEQAMTERGFMHGLELRQTPGRESLGWWRADWLLDAVEAETEAEEDSQFREDGLIRGNRSRSWLRGMYTGHLMSPRWWTKIDLDWVSDQNYLREFDDGPAGYDASREILLDRFGRDIAPKDDLTRTSAVLTHRENEYFGLAGLVEYTQNLAYGGGNRAGSDDPTAQRLPELSAFIFKDTLADSPLEWEMSSVLTNFWRRSGTKGVRLDLAPTLSLPLTGDAGSIIPSIGLRETGYVVETWQNATLGPDSGHDEDVTGRHLPEARVSAFSQLWKVFALAPEEAPDEAGESVWTRVRHLVQPRAEWFWRPHADQEEKPAFDDLDRLARENELTYSLTNVLDRRRETLVLRSLGENATEMALSPDYLEFLRLRLEQSYDLVEAERMEDRDRYPRRPFSDALAELTLVPASWLSLSSRSFFSPYLGELTSHEHSLAVSRDGLGSAGFGLDFQRPVDEFDRQARERIRILRLGAELTVIPRWTASFSWRTDLTDATDLEKVLTLAYHHQCYTLALFYTVTPYEDRVEIQVNLLGLGF